MLTLAANAQSSCAVRVGWLCLLAAHTGLARLAALANPNNGTTAFIKNYTSQLRYGEPTGTCKTVERSQEEQRYRHYRLQQTRKLVNFDYLALPL
ncbi:hypothetical protein ACYCFK_07980 [Stutzerimonas stutzeri]